MTTLLSDERLATFRRWVDEFNGGSGRTQELAAAFLAGNAGDLLAEVERLRAENERLREASVADLEDWYDWHVSFFEADMYGLGNPPCWYCEVCEQRSYDVAAGRDGIAHAYDCICGLLKRFLYEEVSNGTAE